ncbi:MAG: alginate O-acetyltransferase AlgX-related protein [Bacteroidia bacterium]
MVLTYMKYAKREKVDGVEDTSYNKPNLTGIVISDEKPKFSWESWFNGSYQEESEDYNNDHWSMKESMVRLNNQFYYKAFNQIRVNGFVIGKDDYVFSEGYIFSAFGDDLLSEEKVKTLLQKAKVVQDTLKKKGIDLLLVYAPGKGAYCREFVEDKYVHPVKNTNHNLFVSNSKTLGLNYLDLYTLFENLKPKAPYPLFPKFGHHWSYYGECLAVDTIIKHIEKLHNCDLPAFLWKDVEVVDTARFRDADVLKSMNLWKNPEQNMKLAYPQVMFENDSLKNTKRILTISDSYWYGPVYMGVPERCFAGGKFWYYYNKIVPRPADDKVEVWQLDLKQEIESNQVIMLLYSDGNLPTFGNNFISDAYELYTSPATFYSRKERQKQIQTFAKQIRETPGLLKKATLRSKENAITLDSAIRYDAMKFAGMIK